MAGAQLAAAAAHGLVAAMEIDGKGYNFVARAARFAA